MGREEERERGEEEERKVRGQEEEVERSGEERGRSGEEMVRVLFEQFGSRIYAVVTAYMHIHCIPCVLANNPLSKRLDSVFKTI